MPIEGFDYKGFAASMSEQAKELVPKELEDREKEYIVKTLGNFTLLNRVQLEKTFEQIFVTLSGILILISSKQSLNTYEWIICNFNGSVTFLNFGLIVL